MRMYVCVCVGVHFFQYMKIGIQFNPCIINIFIRTAKEMTKKKQKRLFVTLFFSLYRFSMYSLLFVCFPFFSIDDGIEQNGKSVYLYGKSIDHYNIT